MDITASRLDFTLPRESDYMRLVYEAITLALTPWDPGTITAYYTDTMESYDFVYTFIVARLPNLPFKVSKDPVRVRDLTQMALEMAEEAFKFYRYRPALPIDDHIILGEG